MIAEAAESLCLVFLFHEEGDVVIAAAAPEVVDSSFGVAAYETLGKEHACFGMGGDSIGGCGGTVIQLVDYCGIIGFQGVEQSACLFLVAAQQRLRDAE